jgi:tetratricopeptide (TPR) repeat protein
MGISVNEHRVRQLLDNVRYFEQHAMWLHAIQIYRKLLDEYPDDYSIYLRLGLVYMEMGNLTAAEQVLLKALRALPNDSEVLYALGVISYRGEDYDRALFYLRRLVERDMPKAHYSLGLVHWKRSELNDAERHLKRTLELQPDHFDAALALGETRLRAGKRPEALDALNTAWKMAAHSLSGLQSLAAAFVKAASWEQAVACFQAALALDPARLDIQTGLASALAGAGRLDEAEFLYKGILERHPHNDISLMGLGRIAMLRSNHNRARDYFRRVLEIVPDHGEALDQLQYLAPHERSIS